jgi:hypothetical protein
MRLNLLRGTLAALVLGLTASCGKKESATPAAAPPTLHAAHGGTLVALGTSGCFLEFVRDPILGTLRAYLLDRDLRQPVYSPSRGLDLTVTAPGTIHGLTLTPLPTAGAPPGSTAQFETQADWLKDTPAFQVTLERLELRGTALTALTFPFPAGRRP